jgi:uncharacterized protein YkwD
MSPESPRSGRFGVPLKTLFFKTLALGLISCAVALSGPAGTASAAPAYAAKRVSVQAQASQISSSPAVLKQLRKINKARAKNGVPPLRLNACLTNRVAQPYARSMASTGNFAHQEMSALTRACPRFGWAGENIAYGYPTVRAVMSGWMHSEGHRANLLRPEFTHVGLGIKKDSEGRRYWVQDFGG